MAVDSLEIWLDVAEPRRSLEPISILADGRHWDLAKSTAVRDVVTLTGVLPPLCFTPEWRSTFTGNFARLKKENYTLANSSKWKNFDKGTTGNTYLQSQGPNVSERDATTQQQWERNQGFYLNWFSYNSGSDKFIQLMCGWGTFEGEVGSSTWFAFWSDGSVEVNYQGEKTGEGNIDKFTAGTWKQFGLDPISNKSRAKAGSGGGTTQENNYIGVAILPCRGRDILLVSDRGGGFIYTNELIDDEAEDPEITPPGTFWWRVPTGQATVQLAPLRFKTAAYLVSDVKAFRRPPLSGQEPEFRYIYDLSGYGVPPTFMLSLVEADGVTAFTPDDEQTECRIRVDLAGDGTNTPFIYSVVASFAGELTSTNGDEATELTAYAAKKKPPELSVCDNFADVRLSMTLKRPQEIEDAGAAYLAYQSNRPVVATIGAQEIFRGRTEAPEYEEAFSDAARDFTLECRDWWKALENYRFQEAVPYDGVRLDEAFASLVLLAGFPPEMLDIEPIDFYLPTVGSSSEGKYALKPKVGEDTAADFLKKLWESYASIFDVGFKPGISGTKFVVRSPATVNSQVPRLLFATDEDAQSYGGFPARYWPRLIRKYKQTTIEAEANDVWVHGREPGTGKQLIAHYTDVYSVNPALPPSQRPANWLGEYRRFAWIDGSMTTQAAVSWACEVFALRLTPVRVIAEWECDFQSNNDGSPLWRGDLVAIYGYGVFKVRSVNCTFNLEDGSNEAIWRPTRYTGERIALFPS